MALVSIDSNQWRRIYAALIPEMASDINVPLLRNRKDIEDWFYNKYGIEIVLNSEGRWNKVLIPEDQLLILLLKTGNPNDSY